MPSIRVLFAAAEVLGKIFGVSSRWWHNNDRSYNRNLCLTKRKSRESPGRVNGNKTKVGNKSRRAVGREASSNFNKLRGEKQIYSKALESLAVAFHERGSKQGRALSCSEQIHKGVV